jgi:hypothetical protein
LDGHVYAPPVLATAIIAVFQSTFGCITGYSELDHDELCGPEVGFAEIAIDLLQAGFWLEGRKESAMKVGWTPEVIRPRKES